MTHDDVLGPVRACPACGEDWPADEEFYDPGADVCRACSVERVERRREANREAALRYRRARGAEYNARARERYWAAREATG